MAVWMGRRHAYIRPQPTAHRSLRATRFPQIDWRDRWDASIHPPAQIAKKHLQTIPLFRKKRRRKTSPPVCLLCLVHQRRPTVGVLDLAPLDARETVIELLRQLARPEAVDRHGIVPIEEFPDW